MPESGLFTFADDLQKNAQSSPITTKLNKSVDLFTVQAFDGVMQTTLWANAIMRFQRVADVSRPAIIFECVEDTLLVLSGPFKTFDQFVT
jgi:hypothetical protein